MSRAPFEIELQEAIEIAPGVKHFCFTRLDNTPLEFIPGQFVTLLVPNGENTVRRSYSLAQSYPQAQPLVELAASYVEHGIASEFLFKLQPGDRLTASGPFGRLVLRDEQPRCCFLVATGTGVTPYRAMLPEIERRLQADASLQFKLYFGVRTQQDLLYGDEFVRFAAAHDRFEFRAYFSREQVDLPYAYHGYVQQAFTAEHVDVAHDVVYLCGNPNMIDQAFAQLTELGMATAAVRREKYISGK